MIVMVADLNNKTIMQHSNKKREFQLIFIQWKEIHDFDFIDLVVVVAPAVQLVAEFEVLQL